MAHEAMEPQVPEEEARIGLKAVVVWCDMWRVLNRVVKEISRYSEKDGLPECIEEDIADLTMLCEEHLRLRHAVLTNEARKN